MKHPKVFKSILSAAIAFGMATTLQPAVAESSDKRNVILIIGDGMDDTQVTIGRNYLKGAQGRLVIDNMPYRGAVQVLTVHENDPSKKGRFVKVTCGTDRSIELERKIFGERDPYISKNLHSDLDEKTFIEQARGGTLYLEEIDKLSTFSQSLLLQHIRSQVLML